MAHLVVSQEYHDAIAKVCEKTKLSMKAQTETFLDTVPEIKEAKEGADDASSQ